MIVEINNESHHLPSNMTIAEMFEHIKRDTAGIALAINDEVVSKSEWLTKKLNNNDKVLLIRATQGG